MKKRLTKSPPWKSGQAVEIYNRTLDGKVIIEGIATLVSPVERFGDQSEFDSWMVTFPGDTTCYRRTIIPKGWEELTKEAAL